MSTRHLREIHVLQVYHFPACSAGISVDGIRATGGTMGQVWSSLEGSPGKVRTLTLERDGKQFEVQATVQRFLSAEAPRPASSKNTK